MASLPAGSIRLYVLGDARIETSVGEIEPTAELVFAAALYLILERKEPVSRRHMERILWPNVRPSQASHRLRQTLLKLRRLGVPVRPSGQSRLALEVSSLVIDYDVVIAKLESQSGVRPDRLALFQGYDPTFSGEFNQWLDAKREGIIARITRALLGQIASDRVRGNWADVESTAKGLLDLAPLNEEATLALAEAYAMRGSKLDGVKLLDRYLDDIGRDISDLRLPATVMRKRIADRMPPLPHISVSDTPMVERGPMMETLSRLLASARRSQGKACVIWGDPGIGKSRLLSEFAAFASLQGASPQRIQCRRGDTSRPLSVFVDLVPMLRSLRGAIGCSAETMTYLDRLTKRRPLEDSHSADQTDAQFVYSRVEQALFDLFDAVSEEMPLLIEIEDIHWIDAASLDVVLHLVEWCQDRAILFACTTRVRPNWISEHASKLSEILLPPLTTPSAAEVIHAVVRRQGRTMDAHYVEWCIRVADGNPFFLEELAKQWLETGPIHQPPASINAVLEERISRLSTQSLQLLQTCAALEDYSTFERIEAVLRYDSHELLHAVNDLAEAGLLLGFDQVSNVKPFLLQPRHELIAVAALRRLTPPAKAFLHRLTASVLENQVSTDQSTALLWDCAKHWQLAGDSARALQLARSSGIHLLEIGLPEAAAEALEKALGFCSTPHETIDILRAQAKAHDQSSSWAALLEVEQLVRSVATQNGETDLPLHDDLELLALRARWKTNQDEDALRQLVDCVVADEATPEHRVRAGTIALMLQDLTGRQDDMPATFGIVDTLSRTASVNEVYSLEANLVYHTLCGNLNRAVSAANRLILLQREKEDQSDLFRYLLNASMTYRTVGDFERSIGCISEAADIARAHRLPKCSLRALPMLAHLALERGLNAEARHWYHQIQQISVHSDDVYVNIDIQSIEARLAIAEADRMNPPTLRAQREAAAVRRHANAGRTYTLALHTAITLLREEPVASKMLLELEGAHLRSRRSLAQAFASYVLYVALTREGKSQRATELLGEYHREHRRETWRADSLFEQTISQLA